MSQNQKIICLLFFLIALLSGCSSGSPDNDPPQDADTEIPDVADPGTDDDLCAGGDFLSTDNNQVSFSDQKSLDDFGANGYTYAEIIGINNGVYDLSPLACLEKIGKLILRSDDLTSLRGLDRLAEVGELYISSCVNLTDLSGLEQLKKVDLLSVYKTSLVNFRGLNNLSTAAAIDINQNPVLESLDGLQNLIYTPPNRSYQTNEAGYIRIVYNPNLKSISGLEQIAGTLNPLLLANNPVLTEVGSFESATKLSTIVISECNSLQTLDAFPSVNEMAYLSILNCDSLLSVEFPSMTRIGALDIQYCPLFQSMEGFRTLTEIYFESDTGDSIVLNNLPALKSLDGLENVIFYGRKININSNNFSPNSNGLRDVCAIKSIVQYYLNNGINSEYDKSLDVQSQCAAGENLITNFEALCDCDS